MFSSVEVTLIALDLQSGTDTLGLQMNQYQNLQGRAKCLRSSVVCGSLHWLDKCLIFLLPKTVGSNSIKDNVCLLRAIIDLILRGKDKAVSWGGSAHEPSFFSVKEFILSLQNANKKLLNMISDSPALLPLCRVCHMSRPVYSLLQQDQCH